MISFISLILFYLSVYEGGKCSRSKARQGYRQGGSYEGGRRADGCNSMRQNCDGSEEDEKASIVPRGTRFRWWPLAVRSTLSGSRRLLTRERRVRRSVAHVARLW